LNAGRADRGWKAAPTINPTLKILKLTRMRAGENPEIVCWLIWMTACAGMTGQADRLLT